MPRFHCPIPLTTGAEIELPATSARHVQVLRMQPGGTLTLFNGEGGEHSATILSMGRSNVAVRIDSHQAIEREPLRTVHLAVGMPANDRMDWLVEKATELGVTSIQPLHTSHSVLRLSGERAQKKLAHWQSVAVAACEQCGGNRVPQVHAVQDLNAWLKSMATTAAVNAADTLSTSVGLVRCVLSLSDGTQALTTALGETPADAPLLFLSGPEGGLSPTEDAHARNAGFLPVSLGARILRAETAALTALMTSLNQ